MAVVSNGFKTEDSGKGTEKKADYLIPEAVHRFRERGQDVFQESTAVSNRLSCISLPHDFIVTKEVTQFY